MSLLGAQYGWPWVYWGDNFDRRVDYPIPSYINYVRTPEYALGPHVAALGLVFSAEGAQMGEDFERRFRRAAWLVEPQAAPPVTTWSMSPSTGAATRSCRSWC